MDPNGARPKYFVLTYDSTTNQVLSLSGHAHDFTSAVLTLTTRLQEHKRHPEITVRLLTAADLPDLMARHAELFEVLERERERERQPTVWPGGAPAGRAAGPRPGRCPGDGSVGPDALASRRAGGP